MKNILMFTIIIVLFAGCTEEQKQKIHDVKEKIIELNAKYCAETNESKRELLLSAIRLLEPSYPENGLCGVESSVKTIIG
jgi:hypothetical protein